MTTIQRKIITTDKAPIPTVPLSQAVQMNNILYISGQLGMNPDGSLVDGFEAQTRLALENIGHILKAAGASFKNVQKMTVLLQDISQFPQMNKIYAEFFTQPYPARTAYQVAQLPKAGGLIEIEAIAVLGEVVDVQ
ncbi:RutC family protein C23G10.2 [Orchesella cincta]|uniref:RutC family protein C23G10.2 n=1 Tax=Orchesella cincta TaxID=48709 RepID=A0A1D2MGB6_ORCCI|nr:RutC family protein C23G10.2 [Orchesella cincta]